MLRAAVAGLLAALFVGAPVMAAGAPTIGGRISPTTIILEKTPFVRVQSLATIPVTVTLSLEGQGWTLADTTYTLAPGQQHQTAVNGEPGAQPATVTATIRPVAQPAGSEAVAFTLNAALRHITWWEANGPSVLAVLLALGAIAGLIVVARTRRRWAR